MEEIVRRLRIIPVRQVRKCSAKCKFRFDSLVQIDLFRCTRTRACTRPETQTRGRVPRCADAVQSGLRLEDVCRYVRKAALFQEKLSS